MSGDKTPHICEATDPSAGRPATLIFLHGYGDDAEGIPLGMAQQFQWNQKLPYLRWVLPNAHVHPDARERAWYMPKALPNASKPRVPGHDEDDNDSEQNSDDEEGILASVQVIDTLVQAEIDAGTDPTRIVVGGFSQGCAMGLVWGLIGKTRNKVTGVLCMAGYFPLAGRIATLREERGYSSRPDTNDEKKKWLYQHGAKDILIPTRFFERGQEELKRWVKDEDVEAHLYERMGHSAHPGQLRDMLNWLEGLVPP